jgi:hypothetical protein
VAKLFQDVLCVLMYLMVELCVTHAYLESLYIKVYAKIFALVSITNNLQIHLAIHVL